MQQPGRRGPVPERGGERIECELPGDGLAHRPANHAAREEIEDHGEVEPALAGPEVRDVGHPRRVRGGDRELPVEHVGGHGQPVPRIRRRLEPPLLPRAQTLLLHQARHTMPPHGPPLRLQLLVHAGTAVALLACGVDGGDLDGEALRVLGPRRHRARAPRVESGAGHLQDGTQAPHREVGLLLQDEGEPHPCSLTKKAVAFFRMSLSICNPFTSRRSRASSSRSSVVSAPARPRPASTSACRTHARSAVSVRSSSRAIVPRLFSPPCTNRTVSALNSGENDRLVLRFRFPMTPSYRTFVRVGVSTKPGEAQAAFNLASATFLSAVLIAPIAVVQSRVLKTLNRHTYSEI